MSLDDFYLVEKSMYLNVGDELHSAETRSLAKLARAGRAHTSRFVCGMLVWLGGRLVRWGQQLQQQHGSAAPVSGRQSASHLAS